jgi:hypothetical protein
MTIPTGQGLTRGIEAADLPGSPLPRRTARAEANDRQYGSLGEVSDPCYCGKCKMGEGCC